jgi:hypothetical protein
MKKTRLRGDFAQRAKAVVDLATSEEETTPQTTGKNPAAVALGALGASKGGHARARILSPAKRRAIAKKAAKARWK